MKKFEVSLQGMFRKEYFIEAENADEAEEKAKALLKEGPDSMEAKSMSTYIDTLYDLLIRRKQHNKS